MRISASIEVAWNIAAQEAIATEFKEIEPEHFFEALLKMTEIPIFQYKQMASHETIVNQLNNELQDICKELQALNIDSKTIRRSLKAQLGKGNHPFQGGTMHRSPASREIFDRMASIAADEGTEVIMLEHMLKALIESPTSAMVEVLGKMLKEKGEKKVKTPLLNEYGRDLIQQVANGELPAITDRKAESSA
ncbi:MAG: Clp protease N-terminal domain-containing protein, partial [Thermodesulfobacteriota bacterium]